MVVYYLDADVNNADWIKVGCWDTQISPVEVARMPLADLEHLMTLPAWDAAPADVRAAAKDRLDAIAD